MSDDNCKARHPLGLECALKRGHSGDHVPIPASCPIPDTPAVGATLARDYVGDLAYRHASEDHDTFGPYDDVEAAAGVIANAVREALTDAAELCEADGLTGIRFGGLIRELRGTAE